MSTDIDWQRELDASFGSGRDVPPAHYVVGGRGAVRRRRAAVVAAGAGLAVVIAGVAWSAAPDVAPRGQAPVATDVSRSPSATPTLAGTPAPFEDLPWRKGDPPARTNPDGLQVRAGAVVHERRDDLFPGKDTESAALDLTYAGTRWWIVLEWDDGGSAGSYVRVQDAIQPTFDAFVSAQVSSGGMTTEPATEGPDFLGGPVALTEDGMVLAPQAGPVLQRVPNPMGYTSAQGTSVAVRVIFQGREQYSLWALFPDGSTSSMTNDASGDFAGWLAQTVRTQRTLDVANGVTPSSGDTSDEPWLTVGPAGRVEPARRGVVLVEERVDVDLGPGFGDGATRTGAVRLVVDGRTEYAVYRLVDGRLDVIPGGGRFASISAFLAWAATQYASGQGLR